MLVNAREKAWGAPSTEEQRRMLLQIGYHLGQLGVAHRLIAAVCMLLADDTDIGAGPDSEVRPAQRRRIIAKAKMRAEDFAQRVDLQPHTVGLVEEGDGN